MSTPSDRSFSHRLDRRNSPTIQSWRSLPERSLGGFRPDASIECGWGRILFGHTFSSNDSLLEALRSEAPGRRDLAFYLRDPHVLVSLAPQEVFLDPSHSYRLWLDRYRTAPTPPKGFAVRRIQSRADAEAISELYMKRGMAPVEPEFLVGRRRSRVLTYLVAEDLGTHDVIGTVTGIDHEEAFDDPEKGSSLWCLAVDPQASFPGVGAALVRQLAEHFQARGRAYVDLSVMHDNAQAIRLYEQLGFVRVPVFCVKRKNPFNEPLFSAPGPEQELNPYATIVVDEARRRGIAVEVEDAEGGFFRLSFGGRSIACRESLSDLTSAVAMSRCDDKRVTSRLLARAGLRVPEQIEAGEPERERAFLAAHERVVVKPRRGEQGRGVTVDVRDPETLARAIERALDCCPQVLIEELVEGEDLRVVVIGGEAVAAAVRRPASVVGTGQHSVRELIEKQSRRRAAATGGESRIPLDDETRRCVEDAGRSLDGVLEPGEVLVVRKTANLHTGGTIHDVTDECHPTLLEAAVEAARVLEIPVTGVDLLIRSVGSPEYAIVEANERPGLANHEPRPTAERFLDLLFPQTAGERK